jgi:hypothetical protein
MVEIEKEEEEGGVCVFIFSLLCLISKESLRGNDTHPLKQINIGMPNWIKEINKRIQLFFLQ